MQVAAGGGGPVAAGPAPAAAAAAAAAAGAPHEGLRGSALGLLGTGLSAAGAGAPKRKSAFSSGNQPSLSSRKKRRKAMSLDFIQDPKARQVTLNRHLKTMEKTIKMLESSTGANLVCVVLPGGDPGSGKGLRVMGWVDTALMRGVYSDQVAVRTRGVILDEKARENAANEQRCQRQQQQGHQQPRRKLGKVKINVMRMQILALLEHQLTRRASPGTGPGGGGGGGAAAEAAAGGFLPDGRAPCPSWWPSCVGARSPSVTVTWPSAPADYRGAIGHEMSKADLITVYNFLGKSLVTVPQDWYDHLDTTIPTVGTIGDALDPRPAVLVPDIKHQIATRWRLQNPAEARQANQALQQLRAQMQQLRRGLQGLASTTNDRQ